MLAVLGLTTVGLAVASGTVWKPDSVVEARAESGDGTTVLVTDPGVLGLVNDSVQITASRADGGKVVLAIGRENDVLGWVGDDAHTVVTGLETWESLSTNFVEGDTVAVEKDSDEDGDDTADEADKDADAADSSAPDASGLVGPSPADSDMWLATASEDEQATLTWEPAAQNDRLLLLVANSGDDAPPPVLSLTWEREVSTPLMIPGIIVGGVLIAIALLVFLSSRRKTQVTGRKASAHRQASESTDSADTPEISTTAAQTSADGNADEELATTTGDGDRDEAAETETPARQTGMLQGSVASSVAGPTTPVVSRTPPVADDMPTQPMSRRELREMAEREAAEQARNRKSGRVKRRRSQDSAAEETEQDTGEADSTTASTRSSRSTRSVRSTKSVRSTRSVRSSLSAATGSFPQVTSGGGTENEELTAQDRNRADAWRRAWGFQQSWDPKDSTERDSTEEPAEKEDQE